MSEKTKTRSEKVSTLKKALIATAGAAGLSGTVFGLGHSGNEVISGKAIAAHERQVTSETDAEKYLRTPERDAAIEAQARVFSNRIITDAAKHPDQGVDFDDKIDGKKDGRGILTNRIESDGKSYTFKVRVEKNEDGSFELGEGGRYVEAQSSFTFIHNGQRLTTGDSVLYERIGKRGDDGYGAWNVMIGSATTPENGQGMGASAEAGPDCFDPEKRPEPPTVDEMLSTQQQAAAKFDELLQGAHIN